MVEEEKSLEPQDDKGRREVNWQAVIPNLNVGQKMQLAMKGPKGARRMLSKDPNKNIIVSLLKNPRIQIDEVEMIAKSKQSAEEVLREISNNREWMQKYNIVLALVKNPKTPLPLSLRLLPTLQKRDIGQIAKSKDVANSLKSAAIRKITSYR